MSTGADTKANAWGGGTLERGNLRLLEDGSERRGALVFDVVATETAGEWRSEDIEIAVCQGALTQKANSSELVREAGLLERSQRQIAREALRESSSSFGAELVVSQTASTVEAGGEACQGALTERRAVWGGDALERGHGAPLERTAQLGDALSGVGAVAILIDAAELVAGQAATGRRRSECQWALTERRTLGSWFERRAAYSSDCNVQLPLRPLARAAASLGPRLSYRRLPAEECGW